MPNSPNPYRILCLDGGGRWSLISVMALQRIFGEKAKGHDILKEFDLVAANSGGSIVLGALAENMALDQLLTLFRTSGALFPAEPFFSMRHLSHWLSRRLAHFGPKYDTSAKLDNLKALLPSMGSQALVDVPKRIEQANGYLTHFLIVGFDYDWKRAKYFRSNAESLASSSDPTPASLAEAIHASSTAPVSYFDAPARLQGDVELGNRFWDGAVTGHNNPVLAAATEALANGQGRLVHLDIRVLSIGTGAVSLPVVSRRSRKQRGLVNIAERSGLVHDLQELSESILDDPPDSASFEAWIMLGNLVPANRRDTLLDGQLGQLPEPVSLIRMNPLARPKQDAAGNWLPPNGLSVKEFRKLTNIELDARVPNDVELLVKFAEAWLQDEVANQPIRENPYTFKPRIGHTTFSSAREGWRVRTNRDYEQRGGAPRGVPAT
jgi:uncharacterized protein